jgi:hypothetical protein
MPHAHGRIAELLRTGGSIHCRNFRLMGGAISAFVDWYGAQDA